MVDGASQEEARNYFEKGYEAQMGGDLARAIKYYKKSIEIRPTAEGHTYLGWALSFEGRYDEAISECKTAIEIDPEFGNPYNDIGAYLIELGREEEAVLWLRKAMVAPRYEPRHFPHFNLSRIYMREWRLDEAIEELHRALRIEPEYLLARKELHRLLGLLN